VDKTVFSRAKAEISAPSPLTALAKAPVTNGRVTESRDDGVSKKRSGRNRIAGRIAAGGTADETATMYHSDKQLLG